MSVYVYIFLCVHISVPAKRDLKVFLYVFKRKGERGHWTFDDDDPRVVVLAEKVTKKKEKNDERSAEADDGVEAWRTLSWILNAVLPNAVLPRSLTHVSMVLRHMSRLGLSRQDRHVWNTSAYSRPICL